MQDFIEQLMRDFQVEEYLLMYIFGACLVILAVGFVWWYFYRYRITEGITIKQWDASKPSYNKLEGTVYFRILDPETGREINFFGGDIIEYQRVPEERYHLIPEETVQFQTNGNGGESIAIQEIEKALEKDLPAELIDKQKEEQTTAITPFPKSLTVDSATYVGFKRNDLKPQKGEILALEVHGLYPGQDLTSKLRKLKVINFMPNKSKIDKLVIVILLLYNGILTLGLLQNRPPDFILDPVMFGWYFSVGLLMGFQKYLEWTQWGFWGVLRIEDTREQEMTFVGAQNFEINLPVYRVVAHYFPGITLEEAFDVNPLAISTRVNEFHKMLLQTAYSKIISLQKKHLFYKALVSKLREQTDEQQQKIDVARAEGYAEGVEDAGVSPVVGQSFVNANWITQLNPTLKTLGFIGGIIVLGYFLLDTIQSITFGIWEKVWITLGLGIVVLFLLLLVYNYVIRPPTFR